MDTEKTLEKQKLKWKWWDNLKAFLKYATVTVIVKPPLSQPVQNNPGHMFGYQEGEFHIKGNCCKCMRELIIPTRAIEGFTSLFIICPFCRAKVEVRKS